MTADERAVFVAEILHLENELAALRAENERLKANNAVMLQTLQEHGVGIAGDYSEYCCYCDWPRGGVISGQPVDHRPNCVLALEHPGAATQAALTTAQTEAAALRGALEAAQNYIRCVNNPQLSPYIKENGRHGGSPWSELCDAVEAAAELAKGEA
jgi:hypothetical protein